MYRFIIAPIIICWSTFVLGDKLTSERVLSKSVASSVDSWSSALNSPVVVVYLGFDVDVPCLVDDKISDSTQNVASNKSYVWYDRDHKKVSTALLTYCVDDISSRSVNMLHSFMHV